MYQLQTLMIINEDFSQLNHVAELFHITGEKAVDADENAILAHSVEAAAQMDVLRQWILLPAHMVKLSLSLTKLKTILIIYIEEI